MSTPASSSSSSSSSKDVASSSSGSSGGGVEYNIHPLVIMSIADHHTRIIAQQTKNDKSVPRALGVLFGTTDGRCVSILETVEIAYKRDEHGVIQFLTWNDGDEDLLQIQTDMKLCMLHRIILKSIIGLRVHVVCVCVCGCVCVCDVRVQSQSAIHHTSAWAGTAVVRWRRATSTSITASHSTTNDPSSSCLTHKQPVFTAHHDSSLPST